MAKFSKIFVPSIIGVLTYIIANKLVRKNLPPKNPSTDLRGGNGDTIEIVTKTIFEKFTENGPLKLALISVFVTAMYYNFDDEIQKLLAADVFKLLSKKETKGNLKIVCDIVKEYNLDIHSPTMSELIVASHLSNPSKINILVSAFLHCSKIFRMYKLLSIDFKSFSGVIILIHDTSESLAICDTNFVFPIY